jgi:hypothetical protein
VSLPTGISVGPDGAVYLADGVRVRRVGTDGVITTIAGDGQCGPSPDGLPATQVSLLATDVLAAPDGNVYVSQVSCGSVAIRFIKPDGTIATLAGGGAGRSGTTADGSPATSTFLIEPGAMAMSAQGSLAFVDHDRVRQVQDGVVTTLAGNPPTTCKFDYCGDGVPATASNVGVVNGLAFAPDGSLLVGSNLSLILRVSSPLPGLGLATAIPSADGSELYTFDTVGRHMDTRDALTGP